MEHEIEKVIRQKVNTLEENPIAWRKEYVWTQLKVEATSPVNKRIFYYAAASLIAIIISLASLHDLTKQSEISKRLTVLEEAIEKASVIIKNNEGTLYAKEKIIECPEPAPDLFSQNKFDNATSLLQVKSISQINPISHNGLLEDSTVEIEEPRIASTVTIEKKAETKSRVVHAIFSVEPKPTITSIPKQKKIRFRIFRQEDETEPSILTPQPLNLTARINKK